MLTAAAASSVMAGASAFSSPARNNALVVRLATHFLAYCERIRRSEAVIKLICQSLKVNGLDVPEENERLGDEDP
ncbi:hypothetical protein HDU96_002264, partial [Phlyctochytrium bullatum]